MNLTWRNEPDGYAVATLTTTGAVLAIAETDAPGPVQWGSRWIAEGGHRASATLQIDGQTARVLQGQNAGQGLLVVWAIENSIASNELVLMLLGAGQGSASDGGGLGDDRNGDQRSNSGDSGDSGGSANALTLLPIQGQARLSLTAVGNIHSVKPLQAKAKLRLIARQGTAQPPSGLGMQMKIIADPYRPEVILDQSLRVWFNGQPSQCRVALKIDDNAEFEPAFVWQNPGVTQPAILKIDRAEIAGDGQSHLIKVSVWQAVGNRTSARATLSDYAKTPTVRPATQPAWCGATPIRQGETLYSTDGYHSVMGHISDLTRIDWRHTGAVQIMAKVPVANEKIAGFHSSIVTLGYADHDETTFVAEAVGLLIGWRNGLLHEVLFGVASIHHGQFGPVTWANAPVHIREILHQSTGQPLTPDEKAGTARKVTGHLDIRTYPGTFNLEVRESVLTHLGTLPTHGNAIIDQSLYRLFIKIKNIVRQGGSVTLNDLGRFEARWNETRTVRSVGFVASPGFIAGTRAGYPLTDAQAKALP